MTSPAFRPGRLILVAAILGCLSVSLVAQSVASDHVREIASLDGTTQDSVRIEGRHHWLSSPEDVRAGLGALEVRPDPKRDFYGVTISALPGANPRRLIAAIFNPSNEAMRWYVRLQGYESDPRKRRRQPYAPSTYEAPPGWSELEIDLTAAWDKGKTARADCARGVGQLRISRRRSGKDDPALRIDHVRFGGEDAPEIVRKRLFTALQSEDLLVRRAGIRPNLMVLPDAERAATALRALKLSDAAPSTRRAARDALARCGSDGVVKDVIAAMKRAKGHLRLELAWALASMPSRRARAHAIASIGAASTAASTRVAYLLALGRRGATDVAPLLAKLPASRPWPERAAFVRALITCATPAAIDALIALLGDSGSVRVKHDTALALTRLTGKDLGDSAALWASWWKANSTARLNDTGERPKLAYGTYYGIPVPPGRVGFVIDLSGSMRDPLGEGPASDHLKNARHLKGKDIKTRIDLAREELIHAVQLLPDSAWVYVITYNDSAIPVITTKGPQRVTAALKKKLATRLRALSANGKTNIHDGLFRAFHPSRRPSRRDLTDGPDTLFLLTDGNPSVGSLTSRIELRDAVLAWNLGRAIRIHTINLGVRQSRWLDQLARDTDGQFLDLRSSKPAKDDGRKNRRTP